jgi:ribosome biogenesis GTPase A
MEDRPYNALKDAIIGAVTQQASTKGVFPREISAYLDAAVYVLEARAPLATFHIERELQGARIFTLNKADLADAGETKRWVSFFSKHDLDAIPLSIKDESGYTQLGELLLDVWERKHAERAKKGIRDTTLRVVSLGVPNTGKSTVINRLIGRKRARTGDRPGITRGHQWVRIAEGVDLLDTPGVLRKFSRFKTGRPRLLALGLIPEDESALEDALEAVFSHLGGHGWAKLAKFYKVDARVQNLSVWEAVKFIGHRLKGGKMTDALLEDVGYKILGAYRQGRFGRVSLETVEEHGPKLAELLARLEESPKRKPKGGAR